MIYFDGFTMTIFYDKFINVMFSQLTMRMTSAMNDEKTKILIFNLKRLILFNFLIQW